MVILKIYNDPIIETVIIEDIIYNLEQFQRRIDGNIITWTNSSGTYEEIINDNDNNENMETIYQKLKKENKLFNI